MDLFQSDAAPSPSSGTVLLVAAVAALIVLLVIDANGKTTTTTTLAPTRVALPPRTTSTVRPFTTTTARPLTTVRPLTTTTTVRPVTTTTVRTTTTRPPSAGFDTIDAELAALQRRIDVAAQTRTVRPAAVVANQVSSKATSARPSRRPNPPAGRMARHHAHPVGCPCLTCTGVHIHGCSCGGCRPSPMPLNSINFAPVDAWRHGRPCPWWTHPLRKWRNPRPTLSAVPIDWTLGPRKGRCARV